MKFDHPRLDRMQVVTERGHFGERLI